MSPVGTSRLRGCDMKVIGVKETRHFQMVIEDVSGERHEVPIDENTYNHMRQLHARRMPVAVPNNGDNEAAVAAIAGGEEWLEMLQNRVGESEVTGTVDRHPDPQDLRAKVGFGVVDDDDEEEDPGEFHSALDEEEGAPQI